MQIRNGRRNLPVKRIDCASQFDQQRMAFSIQRFARRNLDPTFADAVLGDIGTVLSIKANAYVMLKDGCDVMWAARVD